MFFFLRRIVQLATLGAFGALGWWFYENRSMFSPLSDVVAAYQIKEGLPQNVQGRLSGNVILIESGDSFQMKAADNKKYLVRLTALDAPNRIPGKRDQPLAVLESQQLLSSLVLSNQVEVVVTYSEPPAKLMGFVHCNGTNINMEMLKRGRATLERNYLNGLSLREKYQLLRADRYGREQL